MRCWCLPLLLDAFAWCVARLPQRATLLLGRLLAWLAWPLLRSRRRIARINVDLCFPELDAKARRRIAEGSVVNTVIGVLELIRSWHSSPARLAPLSTVEGLPLLRDALERGGVVVLGGHLTHVELAVRMVGDALGRPLHALVRRHNDPCVEGWIDRSRRRVLGSTIGKKDLRTLLRTLHDGQPVAYLSDQNFNYHHAFVPFFGVPAATMAGLPDIVRRGRATLLTIRSRRDAHGHYHVTIGPAWEGWPHEDPAQDAASYMADLEAAVREVPDQYLWMHKRFKTRPPGAPPVYGG